MTLGERIRHLRHQRNMTLEDVGKYLDVARATVLRYENGSIQNIPSDKLEAMAVLFGVSPAYLMGWDEYDITKPQSSEIPKNDEIRLLVRDLNKLSPEQVEQAKSVFRAMFKITNPELFQEDDDK